MAGFRKTLNLSKICQIYVLPKCDENCLESIPKQNLMKNMLLEEIFLFNQKILLLEIPAKSYYINENCL